MIEVRHRDSGAKEKAKDGHSGDAHLVMGTSATRDGLRFMPAWQRWIAGELRKKSAVLKEKRNAREEKDLNKPPTGGMDG
jgi:hypothetical protein